ncbi:MAG: hypothetical protein AAF384_08990 [Pseudomonadota bacterium]
MIVWRWGAAFGALLVVYVFAGRFVLPGDLWHGWLPVESRESERLQFASNPVLYWSYALSAAAAIWLGFSGLASIVRQGRVSGGFLAASSLAAVAGIGLATYQRDNALGGLTAVFYWWSFGAIWIFTNLVSAVAVRHGSPLVGRDWALYSVGLSLVPVSALPQMPLWVLLDSMTVDEAALTAFIASFAAHYVIAQYLILEVLDRKST